MSLSDESDYQENNQPTSSLFADEARGQKMKHKGKKYWTDEASYPPSLKVIV